MKFGTLRNNTSVLLTNNGAFDLNNLGFKGSLLELIEAGEDVLSEIKEYSKNLKPNLNPKLEDFTAPYKNPPKIIAIGLNYFDHASESKMEVPKTPLVFTKFSNSITGPNDPIKIPSSLTQKVDYEVELGVVIGKNAKNISKENTLDYVFGYTVLNDISARDLQFSDGQWVRGKSLDTFCPLGPVIITKDEIPDPQNLKLGCEINGELLQNDNTKNMMFSVADLISQISHSFTLQAGDIIATGTPSGVGFSRKPPIYLKAGDIVKTWVEGIGELKNIVEEV